MRHNATILIVSLLALLAAMGCNRSSRITVEASDAIDSTTPPSDITEEAALWADSLTRTFSRSERIGQLVMPALYARTDPATMTQLKIYACDMNIGGIVLLRGDLKAVGVMRDSLARWNPRMILAVDAERGLAMRFSDGIPTPWPSQLPDSVEEGNIFDQGRRLADECREAGINMVLGPVADVSSPTSGRIQRLRSFSGDPQKVATMVTAFARGLESGQVMSVAKHFPGHGRATDDSHRGLAEVSDTDRAALERDLIPFREYADAGLTGIMCGHIWAAAADSVRRPASFSPAVITGLLRNRLRFRGLILTDALNMGGAGGHTPQQALEAGADIVLAPRDTRRTLRHISEAVDQGTLTDSLIADRCRRVLFYKYLFGLH